VTDKINQAVEKLRTLSATLKDVSCTCDSLLEQLRAATASREALQEELRMADRELRGAIFEETQG